MTNEQWKKLAATLKAAEKAESTFKPKVKLSPAQKKALAAYNFRLKEEDRYLGSVFVNPAGQKAIEAKTKAAYDACVALGMTWEHGL
jgi:hypothetical protein